MLTYKSSWPPLSTYSLWPSTPGAEGGIGSFFVAHDFDTLFPHRVFLLRTLVAACRYRSRGPAALLEHGGFSTGLSMVELQYVQGSLQN